MVLLHPVIKIAASAVDNFATEYPTYGTRVGIMSIGGHLRRLVADNFLGLSEEPLGGLHISMLGKHGVHQVTVPIYGPVKVAPLAANLHVRFVGIPRYHER